MTHNLGRLVHDGRTFDQSDGLDLVPGPGPFGGPRFVMLHFVDVNLSGSAQITVDLGYGADTFTSGSGSDVWTRPINGAIRPIAIRITGGSGSARLLEFGIGEPSNNGTPGQPCGSRSNPDPFLHTNPFQEPIYETRLRCSPSFAWRNAAQDLPPISTVTRERVAAATGIIVVVHAGHVSSCTGTLIGPDLFLTARHCLTDPGGEDVHSASVCFNYATTDTGGRPAGHVARFFKVLGEVASGAPPTGSSPSSSNDWVILRLDGAPGALPAPLEMRDAELMAGETIFTMHHPGGSVKKAQAGAHSGGFGITGFDYAGGSSGSSLFDASGRVVRGPLSTGGSCSAPGACSVVYAPIAPVKAALATPPPPPAPLDVMVVFDRSGSMNSPAPPIGRRKLEEALDAASLFVQLVRDGEGDRMGLVTFSSMADFVRTPEPAATAKSNLVGPPPFTTGDVGAITASGTTSIGAGVANAILALGSSSPNDRAILLLSDGLQNTPPMIEEVEGFLGATKLCVVGFGSDAEINGPLLNRIAREHGGDFTRAIDGLSLRKFFGLCFGNIFAAGALSDPEFVLKAGQAESDAHTFPVCGEEHITLVLGWDDPHHPLAMQIWTPDGKRVHERRANVVRGRSWVFWRIALPYEDERDGTWRFTVHRASGGGDDVQPAAVDVRYFFLAIADGGPKLTQLGGPRRVYTGDPVDPLVGLHYANRTTPQATVELTIETPEIALGQLVAQHGLRPPATTADAVGGFYATLQDIARQAGGRLPVPTKTVTVPLYDDGGHFDGAMEPDGVYNNRLVDLTRVEGTYQFRAVATYGEDCLATREVQWSIHVEPGIDPNHTDVVLVDVRDHPHGSQGTLVLTPRDRYDNPLGPGRPGVFTVTPTAGVVVTGPVKDRGDGSYGVDVVWDPSATGDPGVVVQQPDRDPVPVSPTPGGEPSGPKAECLDAAGKLLDCLGLKDADPKRVRVKSVIVELDVDDCGCGKKGDC